MNDISNSLNVSLGEQEHLKQFFTIFQEDLKVEHKVEEIGQLVSFIDDLKSQLSDAYEEIQYIRDTLETMQDKTLKAKVEKYITVANEQMEKVKTTYQNTKENVQQTIGQAVENAKSQGIKAVDKAVDVLMSVRR